MSKQAPKLTVTNQDGKIPSWVGIVVLLIAAVVIGVVFLSYFRSQPEDTSQIMGGEQINGDITPENKFYSYKGIITKKNNSEIIIEIEGVKITGMIDAGTKFFRLGIPKTNPEGYRSGKLFDRESITINDIKEGDEVILKSSPDKPLNGIFTFKVDTVELQELR